MREVGRRREFENELPARRIPAFELLERVADVAAEDDRTFVGLHDDDLMSGRVLIRMSMTVAKPSESSSGLRRFVHCSRAICGRGRGSWRTAPAIRPQLRRNLE